MSNLVSAKVHKKVFGSATRKSVMIYFADKASDGGEGIWASKTTIAAELEMHRVTVIRTINELVAEGILVVVGDRRHRNGATVEYDISMPAVEALPDVELPKSGAVSRAPQNDATRSAALPVAECDPLPSATQPVAQRNTMMLHSATQTILKPSKNPSRAGAREAGTDADKLVAFERFWQEHPKSRKRERSLELWLEAEKTGVDLRSIISEAVRYRQVNQGRDTQYLISSDRWLEQRRWEGDPGKPQPSQDERARGVEATAEHLAQRFIDGAFIPVSAWTPAILACVKARGLVSMDQLRSAGVRV